MKKFIVSFIIIAIAIVSFCGYLSYKDTHKVFPSSEQQMVNSIATDLDHDISVPNVKKICDEQRDGFDTTIGPTGWPWGDVVMWEVALFEDKDYYYARLIFHEWVLWWSFDDPYIVCKIPKCNVDGDLRYDEKLRYNVLWDITYNTLRTYDYKPYITNPVIQKINGHTVSLGKYYDCNFSKYFVISDAEHPW